MAADAKLQYATTGGNMTFGIAAKIVGATAMAAISVATAGSLMKDVSSLASDINSLSKVSDISLNTSSQRSADAVSGRNAQYEGVGGCFIAGTKVKTADGEKNIEDVEIGDYVLAENPETGEQEYKKVVRTYIHEKTTLVHVFVGEEEIETTIEHPFYVEGIGFVAAGELRAGDIIRTSNGKNLPIDKVELELLEEPVLVYNFEVEDFHTYYVSGLGVLVHNMCMVKPSNGKTSGNYSGADNIADAARLKEYYRQAEKYGTGSIKELENGRIRFYEELKPARTQGEMAGARHVREWDPYTGNKRDWYETLDYNGNIRQVRPDPNITGGVKVHYMFDADGNYTGNWVPNK